MNLSSTSKLEVLTVVVVPLTVKSPVTVKLAAAVTLPVTFHVPAIEVLPVELATVNLSVLIAKSPSRDKSVNVTLLAVLRFWSKLPTYPHCAAVIDVESPILAI